jgi:2-polyprenyl-3-methyl-5-hydroxy-6-metoxy-1,4-benzoquinol methylase
MVEKYNPDRYHNSSNIIVRFIEFLRTRAVLRLLAAKEGDDILDVGCGAGNMLQKIRRGHLYGVDLSDKLLELARARLEGSGAFLFKGNIEHLSEIISGKKFNKIFCSEVLEHVENSGAVIDEIRKVATNDCRIVISVPNELVINRLKLIFIKFWIFELFLRGISKKMDEEWHLRTIDIKSFKDLVRGKFKIVKIKRIPCIFLPIRYVFLCRVE